MSFFIRFYHLTAKSFNWKFNSFELVSRWRDSQLPTEYKLFRFHKMYVNDFESLLINVIFYF